MYLPFCTMCLQFSKLCIQANKITHARAIRIFPETISEKKYENFRDTTFIYHLQENERNTILVRYPNVSDPFSNRFCDFLIFLVRRLSSL